MVVVRVEIEERLKEIEESVEGLRIAAHGLVESEVWEVGSNCGELTVERISDSVELQVGKCRRLKKSASRDCWCQSAIRDLCSRFPLESALSRFADSRISR